MARSYSDDQWELLDLPRQLLYEKSKFNCPVLGVQARLRHERLLARQTELVQRIRRASIMDRWIMRKYRINPRRPDPRPQTPDPILTDMGIDEVIEDGKIIDRGD
jgi:hypothetical protein